jgi:pSer/pThr/pTyr-binding forkhead associated (FHA) protein
MSRPRLLLIALSAENAFVQPLADGVSLVGRGRDAQIWINHESVSRRHAEVAVSDGEVTVVDLGSRNGTFLNGQRIEGPTTIQCGDELRFGGVAATALEAKHEALARLRNPEMSTRRPGEIAVPVDPRWDALSAAEQRVFRQLMTGLSEKEIAAELHLSVHTVHNHVRQIYREFEVSSRAELMARTTDLRGILQAVEAANREEED